MKKTMADEKHSQNFRYKIFTALKQRNDQAKRFVDVVFLCSTLSEAADFLGKENVKLQIQKTKLESGSGISEPNESKTKSSILQKKIYQLQEELTDLHRNKVDYSEQVIELRKALDKKEKECALKNTELKNAEIALETSNSNRVDFQEKASKAEQNLQLVEDEYAALTFVYSSLDKSKQKLEKEHRDLIAEWMVFKARAADELNAENEKNLKLKQAKLQRELEEAVREPANLSSSSVRSDSFHVLQGGR